MTPAILANLRAETNAPRGVAARIDAADLRQLLDEREAALEVLKELLDDIDDNVDITNSGGPNYAMRLADGIAAKAGLVLTKAAR